MCVRVVVAIALLILPSIVFAQTEKRIALLIGNKDYKAGVGALTNPLNDVRIVGEALSAIGFEVMTPMGAPMAAGGADKLGVFISFSRDDLKFADQLDAGLGLHFATNYRSSRRLRRRGLEAPPGQGTRKRDLECIKLASCMTRCGRRKHADNGER
jgi:hypothetical protein